MPEVSIITPCHNSAVFLQMTADSILAQTFSNWECLLVDDASHDATPALIADLQKRDTRFRAHFFTQNVGAAQARNQAIQMARGRFIAFLDSDDLWLPQKLEMQIAFMKAKNLALTYASYDIIDASGQKTGIFCAPDQLSYFDLLKSCSIGCLTAVYDSQILGKIFMPDIRKRQDFALWLQILKKIPLAYSVGQVLAQYRVNPRSLSGSKRKSATYQWRVYRDLEKLSVLKSAWYFAHYAVRGVLKTYF